MQLQRLARRLDALSAAGDWDALADADRELGVALPRLAAQGAWAADEGAALAQLRHAHREAAARCAAQAAEVAQRLHEIRVHKEGWMAYAGIASWEEERA